MSAPETAAGTGSDFVLGRLGTAEIDVVPDALVNEIHSHLHDTVDQAGA